MSPALLFFSKFLVNLQIIMFGNKFLRKPFECSRKEIQDGMDLVMLQLHVCFVSFLGGGLEN